MKFQKKKNKYEFMQDGKTVIGYATNTHRQFLFDAEDFESVSELSWYESSNGYIHHKDNGMPIIQLHRFIMKPDEALVVDHINHNRRDNRRCNLRICTKQANCQNRSSEPSGITSVVRGKNKYYIVQLFGKYRGCFKDFEEAKKYRDKLISIGRSYL